MGLFAKLKRVLGTPRRPPASLPPSPEELQAKEEHDARLRELRSAIASRKEFTDRVDEVTDALKDALTPLEDHYDQE